MKEQIWQVIRRLNLGVLLLLLHPKSALREEGWYQSFRRGQAVDRSGEPIPWYPYCFIHFLESRLHPQLRVFEYGSGNSTIWFARQVGEMIAVEHDPKWFRQVSVSLPPNGKVYYRELEAGYTEEILHHGFFDIVIIDGRKRSECARYALKRLSRQGVIVWDNSDRDEFSETAPIFAEQGFRELSFVGMAPIFFLQGQTSVLYKERNCLGI